MTPRIPDTSGNWEFLRNFDGHLSNDVGDNNSNKDRRNARTPSNADIGSDDYA